VLPRAPNQIFPAYFCLNFIFILCQEHKDSRSSNDIIRHWCKTNRERWLLSLASSPSPPPIFSTTGNWQFQPPDHLFCLPLLMSRPCPSLNPSHVTPIASKLSSRAVSDPQNLNAQNLCYQKKKVVITCTWPQGLIFFFLQSLEDRVCSMVPSQLT
jgi:hypothetical protein